MITARAPGRVNLIGDHTDYTGGLVCPMAIDLGTTVSIEPGGDRVELTSDAERDLASVPLNIADPLMAQPAWARYVAGVVVAIRPALGGRGRVTTTLPIGAGLSSSAAFEVAVALALGADGTDPVALALACQRAEHLASGVPCGIMDQLVIAAAVAGHALVIDCATLQRTPVPIPDGIEVIVVDSGLRRALVASPYAERRAEAEAAQRAVGVPFREATASDVAGVDDALLRRRARHVVSENARVAAFADALASGDLRAAGALMTESHASLRDDFDVSTSALDELVGRVAATPGVWGARLTGAGFAGCAVAVAEPGTVARIEGVRSWTVTAAGAAQLTSMI